MTWLLVGLAFMVGGFLGCLGTALSCAAKDRDDYQDGFAAGYRSGFDHPEVSLN